MSELSNDRVKNNIFLIIKTFSLDCKCILYHVLQMIDFNNLLKLYLEVINHKMIGLKIYIQYSSREMRVKGMEALSFVLQVESR